MHSWFRIVELVAHSPASRSVSQSESASEFSRSSQGTAAAVGANVHAVGDRVGLLDGELVGARVVGARVVGDTVGVDVVGSDVGAEVVGDTDGDTDGLLEGDRVGDTVGADVQA